MARQGSQHRETDELLAQYLHEILEIPLISGERERELALRIRMNDAEALDELVRANLRFVVSYAKRFRNSHLRFLDLINEGNLGLIEAAKRFDPDKNVKFITYAVWWIRQSILDALAKNGHSFRLPAKQANLVYRLEHVIEEELRDHRRVPSSVELAEKLNIKPSEVERLLRVREESLSLSVSESIGDQGELVDVLEQTALPAADENLAQVLTHELLLDRMAGLPVRERLVLTLRFGVSDSVPMSLATIANSLERPAGEITAEFKSGVSALCANLEIDAEELAYLLICTNPRSSALEQSATTREKRARLPRIQPERMPFILSLMHHDRLHTELEKLPVLRRTVIRLRYGVADEELTLREVGEILHLSKERVRQLELQAEARCRRERKATLSMRSS